MSTQSSSNKRIAKNTLLLYFRMFFIMAVSLFTSRVILNILGVEDYGIYNVVGGVVAMFGFLNSAMSAATQRYITVELGKGDISRLRDIFSISLQIHALISFVIIFFAETIGLWFLYHKMQIPAERMDAAFWTYQCAIIATVITVISVPYNSDIVAHEKMSAFAYISVLEVCLKLAIVYVLLIFKMDKLILYSILIVVVQLFIVYAIVGIVTDIFLKVTTDMLQMERFLRKVHHGMVLWIQTAYSYQRQGRDYTVAAHAGQRGRPSTA